MPEIDSPLPSLLDVRRAQATGSLWKEDRLPATVPVPLPVIMVHVDGPFTALDRKLWTVLLHHAWADLDKPEKIHEISVTDLLRLWREHGRHDLGSKKLVKFSRTDVEESQAGVLWESIRRLAKTTVEFETADYAGIDHLLGAKYDKASRQSGRIYFYFGRLFSDLLRSPEVFARLACKAMLKLRSKYAITLYEILEAYVNRREKTWEVSIGLLQQSLKVPENAYPDWRELKKRVIEPAVREINDKEEEIGFRVEYEGVRDRKTFTKIRFTVTPTRKRINQEITIKEMAKQKRRRVRAAAGVGDPEHPPFPSGEAIEQFRERWKGKDPYEVIGDWQDHWRKKGCELVRVPDKAFLSFAAVYFEKRKAA